MKKISTFLEKIYLFCFNSNKISIFRIILFYFIFNILDKVIRYYNYNLFFKELGIFLYISIFTLILLLNHVFCQKLKLKKRDLIILLSIIFLPIFIILLNFVEFIIQKK